jgi:hypothetical protein
VERTHGGFVDVRVNPHKPQEKQEWQAPPFLFFSFSFTLTL